MASNGSVVSVTPDMTAVVEAEAVLFARFELLVVLLTVAVSLMTAPAATV